jgi:hypothetical protein
MAGIASQNSCMDFTPTSLGSRTLPLDGGSALVEAREKAAQGTASMPTAVTLHTQAVVFHTRLPLSFHRALIQHGAFRCPPPTHATTPCATHQGLHLASSGFFLPDADSQNFLEVIVYRWA